MSDVYETPKLLGEYLLFHYGADGEILPDEGNWPQGMKDALGFPVRTTRWFSEGNVARGLDLGCAVGRSAFEMAKTCDEVIGIDFSHAFITAADRLGRGEAIAYDRLEEGRQSTRLEARFPSVEGNVSFRQGDAMNLPEDLGVFDRFHAANLLCRLTEPVKLLQRLPDLVKSGGELVLATPCTWLEDFTPLGNWPEGSTLEWLEKWLSSAFELVRCGEEPFLIRETARKFQWTSSMMTIWRRR
jgi:putative 4-mercaptohistidine N1-methyltranferase